jgi:hypothetical protein
LRCRPKEQHLGILQEWTEIDHCSHADEDEDGEQLIRDTALEQDVQEAAADRRRKRDIGQQTAKSHGQQEIRLVLLLHCEPNKRQTDAEHRPYTPV